MSVESRREYIAKYNLARYHRRMQEAIDILGGSCIICGSKENLQLDHVDPDGKSFTLGKLWSLSKESFLEELLKCQLLCSDCHMAKTLTFDKEKILAKSNRSPGIKKSPRARKRAGILKQKKPD